MRILIRQGEGPQAAYIRLAAEHAARQAAARKAAAQPIDSKTVTRATAAGDHRKLRGIPAIARGVPGAQPGTIPHQQH